MKFNPFEPEDDEYSGLASYCEVPSTETASANKKRIPLSYILVGQYEADEIYVAYKDMEHDTENDMHISHESAKKLRDYLNSLNL